MPSLTTWNRLELETRHDRFADGLAARLHDPLWTLGRQWQLGEFAGKNAGSALRVDLDRSAFLADRLRMATREQLAQPAPIGPPTFDPRAAPLEALVEQDGLGDLGNDVRLRARGGRYFLDLLAAAQLTAFQPALLALVDWAAPAVTDDAAPVIRRVRGRSPDGKLLFAKLTTTDPAALAGQLAIPAAQTASFVALCATWRAWYAERAGVRPASTWNPDRVDYSFELTAPLHPASNAPVVQLQAREYRGGRLDWDAFHAVRPASAPALPQPAPVASSCVPIPISFPGMPATRFWAMEDGRLDLGNLDAGPGDVGRVLLAEVVLLWANDWFVAPVPVAQTGALIRINGVTVTDSFGVKRTLQRAHQLWSDPDTQWFRIAGPAFTTGGPDGLADYLFIPPVVPASLQAPIEELTIVRDEPANLAWAIERLIPGPLGRPVEVRHPPLPPLAAPPSTTTPPAAAAPTALRYDPMTPARPGWVPLAPVLATAPQQGVVLQRAQVVDPTATPLPPRGALLTPDFRVRNEDVPREGLVLRRRYELARAQDGTLHLWISRDTSPATGETSSGLRFDLVTELPAP